MPYILYKSDPTKQNQAITVQDGTTNDTDTSLTFIGKNAPSFGISVNEDFLYLLENFSNSNPPLHPTEGQLWYDTSNASLTGNKIKAFDGTLWKPVNGIWQQSKQPSGSVDPGDIWVDTSRSQLYITQDGTSWTLIGPTYSSVLKTGSYAETITDNSGAVHNVIKNYINDQVVEVIASEVFYPQPPIYGFTELQPGINLSSVFNSQLNATASTANGLNLADGSVLSGNAVVRTDVNSTINATLFASQIGIGQSSSGGTTSPWVLSQTNGYQANISNPVPAGTFNVTVTNPSGNPLRLLTIDGSIGGIGINIPTSSTPLANQSLDVNGNVTIRKQLSLTTSTTGLVSSGAVTVNNVLTVNGNSNLVNAYITGTTYLGTSNWPKTTSALLPVGTGNNAPDIGSPTYPFGTIYSQVFSAPEAASGAVAGTDAVGNLLVNISTGELRTGDPIYFTYTPLTPTASITQVTTNLIVLSSIAGVNVGMPVTFSYTPSTVTVTGIYPGSGSNPNQFIVNSTAGLAEGMSIKFTGTVGASNVSTSTTYFIQNIVDSTHITVSSSWFGALPFTVTGTASVGSPPYIPVTLTGTVGATFGGLTTSTTYYVQSISGNSIRVSTSYGGSPLSLTNGSAGPSGVQLSIGGPFALVNNVGPKYLYQVESVIDFSHITIADNSGIPISLPANVNLFGINFSGGTSLSTTFIGNLAGGASTLTNAATWKIEGQIQASGFTYGGGPAPTQANGQSYYAFEALLSPTAITSQTVITSVQSTSTILVSNNGGLQQITKGNYLQDIYANLVPTGSVLPYAGLVSKIPSGWLLCDGALVDTGESDGIYQNLFNTIGYLYGKGSVSSEFRLPDLRSRIPLGYDDMNNYPNLSGTTINNAAGLTNNTTPNQQLAQNFAVGVSDVAGEIASSGTSGIYYQAMNYIIKI